MTVADQAQVAEAKQQCELDSGNDVISCFPTESTIILNMNGQPSSGTAGVQNSHRQIPSTSISSTAIRNNKWLTDPQATFTAVHDIRRLDRRVDGLKFLGAAASSLSAASASASSASAASVSASAAAASQSSASARQTATSPASATSTSASGAGSVQPGGGGTSFPKWAIAVIVVLGFFALVASGILAFFIMRRIRNRRNGTLSHRGSMGSSTPMMADARAGNPRSPQSLLARPSRAVRPQRARHLPALMCMTERQRCRGE
ncbi:hypothetical protein A0H81_08648 [Grifola frondosa]|uniref:Mid2 domain-containing protein n=1 Tax=Grifola frondosa TaxID=5627 RepID=A0A1C7M909_GRIFR|nr:hypothetical protein A0H81_08648 [Grifola frondosa]